MTIWRVESCSDHVRYNLGCSLGRPYWVAYRFRSLKEAMICQMSKGSNGVDSALPWDPRLEMHRGSYICTPYTFNECNRPQPSELDEDEAADCHDPYTPRTSKTITSHASSSTSKSRPPILSPSTGRVARIRQAPDSPVKSPGSDGPSTPKCTRTAPVAASPFLFSPIPSSFSPIPSQVVLPPAACDTHGQTKRYIQADHAEDAEEILEALKESGSYEALQGELLTRNVFFSEEQSSLLWDLFYTHNCRCAIVLSSTSKGQLGHGCTRVDENGVVMLLTSEEEP